MGFKLKKKEVKLHENEELELELRLEVEERAAIHGVVKLPNGAPAVGAVVKLFKKVGCDPCDLIPITFAFTDHCGQFLFGVDSNVDFVIKVFFFVPECVCPPKKETACHHRKECDC